MGKVPVLVRRLDQAAPCPVYAHEDDAGADLTIAEDLDLGPGERRLVGTGIAVAIPSGYAGLVYPRSGLAARCGLTMVNSPGVIDAGYRGEVKLNLLNTDTRRPVRLRRGDRVAQLIIHQVEQADFILAETLPDSDRGADGHGSSGGVAAWRGLGGDSPASTLVG